MEKSWKYVLAWRKCVRTAKSFDVKEPFMWYVRPAKDVNSVKSKLERSLSVTCLSHNLMYKSACISHFICVLVVAILSVPFNSWVSVARLEHCLIYMFRLSRIDASITMRPLDKRSLTTGLQIILLHAICVRWYYERLNLSHSCGSNINTIRDLSFTIKSRAIRFIVALSMCSLY